MKSESSADKKKYTVCLVEDHLLAADAITSLLQNSEQYHLVSRFNSAEEYIDNLIAIRPDIVIMDINLPSLSGIEAIALTKELLPDVKILVLTMYEDNDDKIFEAFQAGADGYITKKEPLEKLMHSLHSISDGGVPINPVVARKLISHYIKKRNTADLRILSKRETVVFELIIEGLLYKEIADKLSLSIDSVKKHAQNIYSKLDVRTRSEAIRKYFAG
jgi:DNA-binding NarL/FixJ family response regulator